MDFMSYWTRTGGLWGLGSTLRYYSLTILSYLKPEHIVLALVLAIFLWARESRADTCALGQDRVTVSYGPLTVEGCMSAAERERAVLVVVVRK